MSALQIFGIVVAFLIVWQVLIRIVRKLKHVPAPPLLGIFLDTNLRRFFQPADKLIRRSGIEPGMTVVDLGCGSGAYTTFAAKAAGKQGKVYAADIQPAMLKQLERKLAKPENRDINNIKPVQASAQKLPFDDESIDLLYMVTVLMEIPDTGKALKEIKRVLKTGGVLAVTEWLVDPDYPLSSTVMKMGEREGFVVDEKAGNFWSYTVRFRKPSDTGV